jgi:hypothetical protein
MALRVQRPTSRLPPSHSAHAPSLRDASERTAAGPGNAAIASMMARSPTRDRQLVRDVMAGRAGNRAGARLLQRRTDWEAEAQEMRRDANRRAHEAIERHAGAPDRMAAWLLTPVSWQDWEETQARYAALDEVGSDVLLAVARRAGDPQTIGLLSRLQPTAAVLMSVARRLRQHGQVTEAERLVATMVSPTHAHLLGESATRSQAVQSALGTHSASVQSVTGGSGIVVYDDYSIVMDAMPPALGPEQYLQEMAQDLNRAVGSSDFNDINVFARTAADRRRGAPAVGDVYDIDILGPDNGSVMLVESASDHFTFQTVTVPQTGSHPEYGSREFGFERADGAVRFYTRGVSRPSSDVARIAGGPIQEKGWTALLTGIAATLTSRGGKLRAGSFTHWIKRG